MISEFPHFSIFLVSLIVRQVFLIAAIMLMVLSAASWFVVKASPASVGLSLDLLDSSASVATAAFLTVKAQGLYLLLFISLLLLSHCSLQTHRMSSDFSTTMRLPMPSLRPPMTACQTPHLFLSHHHHHHHHHRHHLQAFSTH
jgi:hypothetical protein